VSSLIWRKNFGLLFRRILIRFSLQTLAQKPPKRRLNWPNK